MTKSTLNLGVSLLEILIVIGIFSILAVVSAQIIIATLRGAKKSDSLGRVRENVDYALSVIERQLRNASLVSPCPNTSGDSTISYKDQNGISTSFSCVDISPSKVGYIASGSGRLTSDTVDISACSFVCTAGGAKTPPHVDVTVTAQDATVTGAESSQVSSTTKIYLRTY